MLRLALAFTVAGSAYGAWRDTSGFPTRAPSPSLMRLRCKRRAPPSAAERRRPGVGGQASHATLAQVVPGAATSRCARPPQATVRGDRLRPPARGITRR